MPIKVFCPKCDARVTAPDKMAGKTVDCPECDAVVKVPRPADDDEEDRPRSRRRDKDEDDEDSAQPRSRRRNRDDDDDGRQKSRDRDDRPRKSGKNKGKKKKKANTPLILALAGGGLFALIAIGVVIGALVYRSSESKGESKEIAGEEWYKADEPDGMFTAYFPGEKPKYEKFAFTPPAFVAKKAGVKNAEDLGWRVQSWMRKEKGREYSVSLISLPSDGSRPDAAVRAVAESRVAPGPGVTVGIDDTVTYGAHQGKRLATKGGSVGKVSVIFGIGHRTMLVVLVTGGNDVDHNDPKVKTFLENFTMHK